MHILLRPVPVLSGTLERCLATFFLAAAKCANIDIAISTPGNAGHHRQENGTMRHASEYGSRNLGTRRGRHAAKTRGQGSAAVARSSAGRRAPAARQGRCAPRRTRAAARARGGLAWVSAASAETSRDRAYTTPLPVAAVAAPPCSRRSCRPPYADPSPAASDDP